MKKEIILVLPLLLLVISLVSSELTFAQSPESEYYLGQNLKLTTKVVASSQLNNFIVTDLICDGKTLFSEDKFISLSSGEEDSISTTIPLIRKFVGSNPSSCNVEVSLGSESISSDSFNLLNKLNLILYNLSDNREYSPEEVISIEGFASKNNLEPVNGIVSLTSKKDNLSIEVKGIVTNGDFKVQFKVPKNSKSGQYIANLVVSERDYTGETTTSGSVSYPFSIAQIPNNLEIMIYNSNVTPGENIQIKSIMHDQIGDNVLMDVTLTLLNSITKEVLFKEDVPTGEFFSYFVNSSHPSGVLIVEAKTDEFSASKNVFVTEKKLISTEIVNSTLVVSNLGNVFFNDSVLVNIGGIDKEVLVSLEIGEKSFYSLFAPSGVYDVSISSSYENSKTVSGVLLTGNAVDIKNFTGEGFVVFIANPFVWGSLIVIVGGFAYFMHQRLKKKKFSGHFYKRREESKKYFSAPVVKEKTFTSPVSSATVSSSIKGEEQEAVVVCLKIKNYSQIENKESNVKEVLQGLTDFAQKIRASTYENNGTFLFILAPVLTKTFDNEKAALDLADKIKQTLSHHNRYFKYSLDYGISINKGKIVANLQGRNSLEFSGLGNFLNIAKRIANISKGEIFLGEAVKDKIMKDAKLDKHSDEGLSYYSISEVKNVSESRERVNEIYRKMQN